MGSGWIRRIFAMLKMEFTGQFKRDYKLVYKVFRQTLILKLIRTGTHSDLF